MKAYFLCGEIVAHPPDMGHLPEIYPNMAQHRNAITSKIHREIREALQSLLRPIPSHHPYGNLTSKYGPY